MIKIYPVILLSMISVSGIKSQTCEGYFPMNKGSVMETTAYNEKGKSQSVSTITIKDIEKKGDDVTISIHSDIVDAKAKPVASSDYDAKCDKGTFSINMKSMLSAEQMAAWKDMTVTMEADDIVYPLQYTAGEKLKDAHLKVIVTSSGMNLPSTTIDITNRIIVGNESITTPAGTFDCIKITADVKIKNIFGYEVQTIEWLSRGSGVIRTESYKGGKMKGYTELTILTK